MRLRTYRQFWPFYLSQHAHPWTQRLHVMGTTLGIAVAIYFSVRQMWTWIPLSLVVAYGFAWASHGLVEKNRPATFRYPLWSFVSDFKMIAWILRGRPRDW